MSVGSKLNEILLVDRERGKSKTMTGFDNSDLKVMIIKDYFNHKQRGNPFKFSFYSL